MKENNRLISLDVFRGLTIILMTLVNNPGSWGSIYEPLEHAEWNGCTLADLVFPFFVFIMGVAVPFSTQKGIWNKDVFVKILGRSLRIICLGFALSFFRVHPFFGLEGISLLICRSFFTLIICYLLLIGEVNTKLKNYFTYFIFGLFLVLAFFIEGYEKVRIPGVLQRIGLVYLFIAFVYIKFSTKQILYISGAILLGYWGLLTLIDVPHYGAANLNKATNLAAWFDDFVMKNHVYVQDAALLFNWDPEGILSTLPALVTGALGVVVGFQIKNSLTKNITLKLLLVYGLIFTILGYVWGANFPINKALWTSSYVLYTAGLATLIIAGLYYLIDIKNYSGFYKPFLIWGVNPMLVFFFSGLIPRIFGSIEFLQAGEKTNVQKYLYHNFVVPLFESPFNQSLAGSVIYVFIWTFILWLFNRSNKIFKV